MIVDLQNIKIIQTEVNRNYNGTTVIFIHDGTIYCNVGVSATDLGTDIEYMEEQYDKMSLQCSVMFVIVLCHLILLKLMQESSP